MRDPLPAPLPCSSHEEKLRWRFPLQTERTFQAALPAVSVCCRLRSGRSGSIEELDDLVSRLRVTRRTRASLGCHAATVNAEISGLHIVYMQGCHIAVHIGKESVSETG